MIEKELSVMVTGASGFLGRHLLKRLEEKGFRCFGYTHGQLDITDVGAVLAEVSVLEPDIVVHCAAIASTAYANSHPEESMAVNVKGCENLALACRRTSSKLYVMSSDQVYGGCSLDGPLSENLTLAPNNIYGEHKLLMEGRVLDILPDAVAYRLPWMYERFNEASPHTDIVSRLTAAVQGSRPMKFSTREYRGMTNVDTVCDNIMAGFGKIPGGVYNFGSGNALDSYSTMQKIARETGLPRELIVPDDSWGRNLSMDTSKLSGFGIVFPDTAEALVATLKGE